MMRLPARTASLVLVLAACGNTAPAASSVPDSTPDAAWSVEKVGQLDGAVDLVERSPADPFFFVVSRNGTVERWSRDGSRRERVLDVSSLVSTENERGLLGLAFRERDGGWEAFVDLTGDNGDLVVSRFAVADDGSFSPSSGAGDPVISIPHPRSNHNGGDLEVGPDGMLYVSTGDGGGANDPDRAAHDTSSLLGKILRIDPRAGGGYDVPDDNPLVGVEGARDEIWSWGLRNPWRFTFDGNGDLWIADVGQSEWEEIDRAPAADGLPGGRGVDFGWSAWEGTHRFNTDVSSPDAMMPVHEYPHDEGRCSIIGGAVATQAHFPGRAGWYFFSDWCSGRVEALVVGDDSSRVEPIVDGLESVVAVRSTSDSLWIVSLDGTVSRLVAS